MTPVMSLGLSIPLESRRSRRANCCARQPMRWMPHQSHDSAACTRLRHGRRPPRRSWRCKVLSAGIGVLFKCAARGQNRRQAPIVASAVKESIEMTLEHIARELEQVNREIERVFDEYPPLRRGRDLLTSIPDIGVTTAARILGERR